MGSLAFKYFTVAAAVCCLSLAANAQQSSVKASASVATPRTADGHPDLSGLWNGAAGGGAGGGAANANDGDSSSLAPEVFAARQQEGRTGVAALINFERDNTLLRRMGENKPQYKPRYWETVKNLDQNGSNEDPGSHCMPLGIPRAGPPTQIMQSAGLLIFLYGASPAAYRVIPIDGRKHTPLEDLDGTANGESIGHWEGDTLVIDSIGFNTATWLDISGYFHSENMHVVERLTRNANNLTWQATVDDPDVLLKPWTVNSRTMRLNTTPEAVLPEPAACSERDFAHVVTKEHH